MCLLAASVIVLNAHQDGKHGDHDHHHEHHEHTEHKEDKSDVIVEKELTFESLFPAHLLESKDANVQFIIYLCRLTNAHKFIVAFDKVMKPLPQVMQAMCSTLFISIVPIFLIYGANSLFLSNKKTRESMI